MVLIQTGCLIGKIRPGVERESGRKMLSEHLLSFVQVFQRSFEKSRNFPVRRTQRRGAIGLRTEEAGLGSGGRGKSEIFPALQKCSDEECTRKLRTSQVYPSQYLLTR
jgi:hypothetical protein